MSFDKFPARFEPDPDGGFVVSFRDIPEAITQGDTLEEAESMAQDALVTAMDFYFEDGRPVPAPSRAEKGERLVGLPPSVVAKVALLNARIETGARPADVARAIGVKPQEMTRVFDLQHATKIDTIAAALAAMGHTLNVSVRRDAAYIFDARKSHNLATIASVKTGHPKQVLVVPEDDIDGEPILAVAFVEPNSEWMKVAVPENDLPFAICLADLRPMLDSLKRRRSQHNEKAAQSHIST